MTVNPKDATAPTGVSEPPVRKRREPSAAIAISWSSLAFTAGALGVASTSALAIIATLNHADSLSTIALALAILSFIIQIGLFVAQSWTSGQQVLHSEEVNSDTRTILAEVRENARGTNQLISEQFERVLGHLLQTTRRTVNESLKGEEARILNERLARELRRTLTGGAEPDGGRDASLPTPEQRTHLKEFLTPFSDTTELENANSIVRDLTPRAIADFSYFAKDEVDALRNTGISVPGLFESLVPHVDELLMAGLVEKANAPARFY